MTVVPMSVFCIFCQLNYETFLITILYVCNRHYKFDMKSAESNQDVLLHIFFSNINHFHSEGLNLMLVFKAKFNKAFPFLKNKMFAYAFILGKLFYTTNKGMTASRRGQNIYVFKNSLLKFMR